MSDSWEGLLNELNLPIDFRERSYLKVWDVFPLGFPKRKQLTHLAENMKELLKAEKYFNIITFDYNDNNYYYSISEILFDNMEVLREMWLSRAGKYILILSDKFIHDSIYTSSLEEEIIGRFLMLEEKILLKTPDGHELLYMFIK